MSHDSVISLVALMAMVATIITIYQISTPRRLRWLSGLNLAVFGVFTYGVVCAPLWGLLPLTLFGLIVNGVNLVIGPAAFDDDQYDDDDGDDDDEGEDSPGRFRIKIGFSHH